MYAAAAAAAKSLQSCLTLCDPPPGSSVPGILQARILEGVAIFSNRIHVSLRIIVLFGLCPEMGLLGHMVVLF